MYGLSEESLTIVGVILIVVGVAMIGWGFEWNQDIPNDKRVGTVVRDIGVMVLATGIIFVMDYKALQKRSKKTKINAKTGRAHTKKRFGKSLSHCAPAMFISILNKKANRYGGSVIKVSTFETKASQFDHTDESYTKKKLSERMAHLSSGEVVQRDLYSAFLLEYIDTESLEYNTKALNSAFPAFLEMHENTKRRLQAVGSSLPASIGF